MSIIVLSKWSGRTARFNGRPRPQRRILAPNEFRHGDVFCNGAEVPGGVDFIFTIFGVGVACAQREDWSSYWLFGRIKFIPSR